MSAVFSAVLARNLQEIKRLLESGIDINEDDLDGNTALHYAASLSFTSIVKYLVENGADINRKNCHGDTPLLHACKADSLELVKYLVEHGAEINSKNWIENTVLHHACRFGSLGIVKYLFEHGADVNAKNWNGDTSLHEAVNFGALEKVEYLIEHGYDMESKNNQNETGLHRAVRLGSLAMAKCLVKNEAKIAIDRHQNFGRETVIFNKACEQENEQIVFHLSEQGAISDTFWNSDLYGDSFLSIACSEGSTALVRSLLKFNVDLLRKEKKLFCGNPEILRILKLELNKSVKHREKIKILKGLDDKKLTKVRHFD
jgi:ankyrin repeat protein